MSLMPYQPNAVRNPFLGQVLVGSGREQERIRFPITFSVERESRRIWSLRMAPAGVTSLARAIAPGNGERLLLVSGGGAVGARLRLAAACTAAGVPIIPARALHRLEAPLEVIHLGPRAAPDLGALEVPETLLSDPEASVPRGLDSRFALSIQDGCHGMLYTPDPDLLRDCLRAFLQDYQVSVLGRDAHLPALPDGLLAPLLEPLDPETYHEVRFEPRRRFWTLDVLLLRAGEDVELEAPTRWVSEGEGGSWRTGWSW